MNKYLKGFLQGAGYTGVGLGMLSLFVLALGFLAFGFGRDYEHSRPIFFLYSALMLMLLGGIGGIILIDDKDDKRKTTHTCNICNNNLKVGEGEHYRVVGEKVTCYCLCPKCLPTVKI